LRKHFAVLGTTGSGKSCAVSLLLSAILADYPMAHIVLIDPHNEYGRAFAKAAEVINVDNLQLPFWLFDFEEAVGILIRGGTAQEQEAQALILKDDSTIYFPRIVRKDYSVALGASAGGNDPDQGLYTTYMCNAERNYTGYCNPEVDELIERQSREADQEKRKRLVWEVEKKLAEDSAQPGRLRTEVLLGRAPVAQTPRTTALLTITSKSPFALCLLMNKVG